MSGHFYCIFHKVMVSRIFTCAAVALCAWFVTETSSAIAERPDFLVNDDAGYAEQNHPRIAVSGDGGFIIVWTDKRNGPSDIFLQKYDPAGSPVGANVRVNDDSGTGYQHQPAVAVDLTGFYAVVWNDYRAGLYPFDPDIFYQRFDSAGLKTGANLELTSERPDTTKESPDISLSAWGTGVVVWADYRNRGWDIYGQLIASDGSLISGNFRVNDDQVGGQQHAPRVSTCSQGWFVVAWYDNRLGTDDIWVQRFDSLGNRLGPNCLVNDDAGSSRQAFPDVATDGAGHFTVVWVDWRHGNYPDDPDIYACKLDTAMVAITENLKINTDLSTRAQREAAIAADRMGHVAIIWSDSASTSWDIIGQMIDVNGAVREVNFQANSYGDSAQLKPDVALDGNCRYVTWVDNRNGNYDIYASITRYNDPHLVAAPNALRFEMQRGQGLPAPQQIAVEHVGYNPLPFDLTSSTSWLAYAPSSAVTPETVQVSITCDTLGYGSHFGAIRVVDTANGDSSIVIEVRLDVVSPILSVAPQQLSFAAARGVAETHVQDFSVSNLGVGEMSWVAVEGADWLTLSAHAGVAPSTVEVQVDACDIMAGSYLEPVVVAAPEAIDSPDTLWVAVEVIDNSPVISVEPDSIHWATSSLALTDTFVVVRNVGAGDLSWKAVTSRPWLSLSASSGSDQDTISILFDVDVDTLPTAMYTAYVEVYDSAASNVSDSVSILIDHTKVAVDTFMLDPSGIEPLAPLVVPVRMMLNNDASSVILPVQYDPLAMTADSVVFCLQIPPFMERRHHIDEVSGLISMSLDRSVTDTFLMPDRYVMAEMYFTAGAYACFTGLAAWQSDSLYARVVGLDGSEFLPVVEAVEIPIGSPTSAEDLPDGSLPDDYTLSQNYPNPFNSFTTVEFSLPERSRVLFEVYNILGQLVATLMDQSQPVGRFSVTWDGALNSGLPAPSGIYFYRLKTESASLVKKMVLVR